MPRWSVCSTVDCAELHVGSGRCPDCRRAHDAQRGTRQQRGYGSEHDKLRAQAVKQVSRGGVRCARCGELINPDEPFDLDHRDDDRTRYLGPSHTRCNRATASRRGE